MRWLFDSFCLDLERRELQRGSQLVELEPLAFDLLVYLIRHRDRVIGKDELIEAVWHGRIVSDTALTTRINAVRRALGDDGRLQHHVRTHARAGVRFIAEVREAPEPVPGTGALPKPQQRCSIAILPFLAVNRDAATGYLATALAEDLLVALCRFPWFSVLGPLPDLFGRAGFRAPAIRGELGADYALFGTVRHNEGRLRVTVRLIDLTGNSTLWGESFEGSVHDGFALQDRVAVTAAGVVAGVVQSFEARRRRHAADRDATPYDFYLRAHPIFSSGFGCVRQSIDLLEEAVALDPDYGPALADAANCYQILDVNGWVKDRRANQRKAIALARRALRASTEPVPVAIAAFVLAYFGQDPEVAAELLDDAMAVNPSFATGWYMSGMSRLYAGQPERAIECFEASVRLNAHDLTGRRTNAGFGFAQFFSRHLDEAIPRLRRVVQEFPHWATPYCMLASSYAQLGFDEEAARIARRLRANDPSLIPSAVQFRNERHRELLAPGLHLVYRP
jgi:DNA-binding winged helix-turn-helix (wHTH) protein/tetratricopeptide (TPR) repeat protein